MTLDFIATPWGFACVLVAALLVMGLAVLVAQGKLRFKKTKDGSMIVGDDTPFEKTNARFKQLCQDTHKIAGEVPVLTEKMAVLTERLSVVEKAVGAVAADQILLRNELEGVQVFILRSTITNERLPAEERMRAYDEYKKRGLNSWVDAYWECELPELKAALKGRLVQKV
jgi:hypothetical protein